MCINSWQLKIFVIFLSSCLGQAIFRVCERDFCYERDKESERFYNKRLERGNLEPSSGRVTESVENRRFFVETRKDFRIKQRTMSDITRHVNDRNDKRHEMLRQLPKDQHQVLRKLNEHFDTSRSQSHNEGTDSNLDIRENRRRMGFGQEKNYLASERLEQRISINKREHQQENVRLEDESNLTKNVYSARELPSDDVERFEENEQNTINAKNHLQTRKYFDARRNSDGIQRFNRNEREPREITRRQTFLPAHHDFNRNERIDANINSNKKMCQFEYLDECFSRKECGLSQRRSETKREQDTCKYLDEFQETAKQPRQCTYREIKKGLQRRSESGPNQRQDIIQRNNVRYIGWRSEDHRQTESLDIPKPGRNVIDRPYTSYRTETLLSNSEIPHTMRRRSEDYLINKHDERKHLLLNRKHYPQVLRSIVVHEPLNRDRQSIEELKSMKWRIENNLERQERAESLRMETDDIETLNHPGLQYRNKRTLGFAGDYENEIQRASLIIQNRKSIQTEDKAEHGRRKSSGLFDISQVETKAARNSDLVRDAKIKTEQLSLAPKEPIEDSRRNEREEVRGERRPSLASQRKEYIESVRHFKSPEDSVMRERKEEHLERRIQREIQKNGRKTQRLETGRFDREVLRMSKSGESSLDTLQQLTKLRYGNYREEEPNENLSRHNKRYLKNDEEPEHLYGLKEASNEEQREHRESKLADQQLNKVIRKAPVAIRLQDTNTFYRDTRFTDQDIMQKTTVLLSYDHKSLGQGAIFVYVVMITFIANNFVKNPLPVKLNEALKIIGF